MRFFAAALAAGVATLVACGKDSAAGAAPPPQAAPEPGGATTSAAPSPAPSPGPSPEPQPSPAPAPSPAPGASPPAPAPRAPAVRWAVAAPGVFWVGMDDSAARWSAADDRGRGVLRLEKRDRGGTLLWSGEWTYRGTGYRFTAAVTPGGEPAFAASSPCDGDPACGDSLLLGPGAAPARGSVVVRLGADGTVRWTRQLSGFLVGADAAGGLAVGWSRPAGSSSYVVLKLDRDGNPLWSRELTSLLSLRLDRTGALLAAGCYQDDRSLVTGVPCAGVTAARLGLDGTPRWRAPLEGYWPVIDTAADGTGYAVGRAFFLTALSPDGAVRWSRKLDQSPPFANQRGDALAIAAAANGPVAVAGYTYERLPDGTPGVHALILGFDAAGTPSFADLLPFPQPTAMVYGADGQLLLAVQGGGVDAPGGHVDGPAVVELTP